MILHPGFYILFLRDKRNKLSRRDLAKSANISDHYVYLIESGETKKPSRDVLFRIATVLDMPALELGVLFGYATKIISSLQYKLLAGTPGGKPGPVDEIEIDESLLISGIGELETIRKVYYSLFVAHLATILNFHQLGHANIYSLFFDAPTNPEKAGGAGPASGYFWSSYDWAREFMPPRIQSASTRLVSIAQKIVAAVKEIPAPTAGTPPTRDNEIAVLISELDKAVHACAFEPGVTPVSHKEIQETPLLKEFAAAQEILARAARFPAMARIGDVPDPEAIEAERLVRKILTIDEQASGTVVPRNELQIATTAQIELIRALRIAVKINLTDVLAALGMPEATAAKLAEIKDIITNKP